MDSCFIFLISFQRHDWTWGDRSTKELPSHWLTLGLGFPRVTAAKRGLVLAAIHLMCLFCYLPRPRFHGEAELWALDSRVCLKYWADGWSVCVPDPEWFRSLRKDDVWNHGNQNRDLLLPLSHCPVPEMLRARVQRAPAYSVRKSHPQCEELHHVQYIYKAVITSTTDKVT